jgi:predicted Zn-dependent protease
MKKIISLHGLLVLLILTSCSDYSSNEEVSKTSDNEKITSYLNKMGILSKEIEYTERDVIIGGDAFYRISKILDYINDFDSKKKKQYKTTEIVSAGNAQNITININALHSSWLPAFNRAIEELNGVRHAKLNFTTTTSSNSDINIIMVNNGSNSYIGRAEFPDMSTNEAGSEIRINSYYNSNNNLSLAEKYQTIIHEIGHTLGLRHTNWFDRNSDGNQNDNEGLTMYGAVHIPGTTPGLDSQSFMNAFNCPWSGFSSNDYIALRYLFPPDNNITAPTVTSASIDWTTGSPKLIWSAVAGADYYRVYREYGQSYSSSIEKSVGERLVYTGNSTQLIDLSEEALVYVGNTGGSYAYRVVAVKNSSESNPSSWHAFAFPNDGDFPEDR